MRCTRERARSSPGIRAGRLGEAAASARGRWGRSCGTAYRPGTFQVGLEQKHKGGKVWGVGSCRERGEYFNTIRINVNSVLGCGDYRMCMTARPRPGDC